MKKTAMLGTAMVVLLMFLSIPATGASASNPRGISLGGSLQLIPTNDVVPNACNPCGATGAIIVQSSHKCLDVVGGGTGNGTRVQQWTCNGNAQQRFTFTASGTIVATHSGKCLDIVHGSGANGTPVQIWACNGNAQQRWEANLPVGEPTYKVVSSLGVVSPSGTYAIMDIAGGPGATNDGARLQIWDPRPAIHTNQRFATP